MVPAARHDAADLARRLGLQALWVVNDFEALAWSLHIGETLRDIDEPADLASLRTGLP